MRKKKIEIRKFLYYAVVYMLMVGIVFTFVEIGSEFTDRRERKLIQQAKDIQPYFNAEESIQDGLRAFFGNDGTWTIVNGKIHVWVHRGYYSAFPISLEFEMPKDCLRFDNTKDTELWIFENVLVDGEEQTPEQVHSLMSTMIISAQDFEREQE